MTRKHCAKNLADGRAAFSQEEDFVLQLRQRGLVGVEFVASDDYAG